MVFLKIFNKISVPVWESGCLRKHNFLKKVISLCWEPYTGYQGLLIPFNVNPNSAEGAHRHRAVSVVIQDTAGIPVEGSILSMLHPMSAEQNHPEVCQKPSVSWAAVTVTLPGQRYKVVIPLLWVFFSPCSCQLRYTNMLATAGRSLAKNPACIYYEVHLGSRGSSGNCICPLHAVKSVGSNLLAH